MTMNKTANQALQEALPGAIEDAAQILQTLKAIRDHGEQTSADCNLATAIRNVARRLADCREFMAGTRVAAGPGLVCPACGHAVDDADYWAGDRCLLCALEQLESD